MFSKFAVRIEVAFTKDEPVSCLVVFLTVRFIIKINETKEKL
jgi:hypothetical protein